MQCLCHFNTWQKLYRTKKYRTTGYTMKSKLSILLIMFLFGCGNSGQIEQELSAAAKLMRSEPDSSLRIIENIDLDRILRRSTRAKYALLYSAALDKNYVDADDDSLIRIAYRYYNGNKCSDSVKFLINYHYGRICQNGDDYQNAICYYLTAEKYALAAHKNYYLGLVYSRIGEVYSEQMNFNGAQEYYQNAYEAWKKLRNPAFMNNATLNIANTYSSLGDTGNAVKYYSEALAIAREQEDTDMVVACLSNLGDIYVNEGDYSKALQAVKEIERTAPDDLFIYQYRVLAKVYYLQHKIDSARYYFSIASELAEDIRDDAQLAYLSIQIELASGNSKEAANSLNEYIRLSDSISRMVVSQSATAVERKYYKEQTAFASYRLKVRTYFECIVGLLVCTVAIFLTYYYRERMKRKQQQVERYMLAVDSIRESKNRILEHLAVKEGQEVQLKELVLSRFEFLDQLGWAFYERNNTKAQQEAIYKQVRNFFTNLASNPATKKELEEIVNMVNDNIIVKLRKQFPKFKPADIDLLCYIYAGFSTQIISVITGDSVSNIYNRKSRLKARIAASDSAEKDFFIRKM